MKNSQFLKLAVTQSFDQAANAYDEAAFIQNEIGERLFERLDYMRIEPTSILDVGCGTGHCTQLLKARYPKSDIFALDISAAMLKINKHKHSTDKQYDYLCGDVEQLPIATNSVDLIFSNLMLHWCTHLTVATTELQRILKPNGLLLFSTLGPDTFRELRQSWINVDNYQHVHDFVDMHDIGDALVQAKFADPVMDMEQLTVDYQELNTFFQDLKKLGGRNIAVERLRGLMSKTRYQQFLRNYEAYRTSQGSYPVTYEAIYGHAWGNTTLANFDRETNEVTIPLSFIQKKK